MTKYSKDTLVNLISHDQENCRRHKAQAEANGYQAGVEYWQKELDDLEKLSQELIDENII